MLAWKSERWSAERVQARKENPDSHANTPWAPSGPERIYWVHWPFRSGPLLRSGPQCATVQPTPPGRGLVGRNFGRKITKNHEFCDVEKQE